MRFAVIGCGWITGAIHAPAYASYMKEHPELLPAACCDVDPERAAETQARFGFQRAWSDPLAMLAEEKLDAVCLNVPPAYTCRLGSEVLRRGLALITEKPPGLNSEELEQLIAAAQASGAPHMVAFNRRWIPLVSELRQRTNGRSVENIQYSQVRVGRTDPDFGITAIHAIDAVRFLAGSDYRQVEIRYQELPEVGAGVANFSLCAEMAGGALATLTITPLAGMAVERALVSGCGGAHCGSHGGAHGWTADLRLPARTDGAGRLEIYADGVQEFSLDGAQAAGGNEAWRLEGFYQEDAAFFDALLSGQKPAHGLESARQSVAIMQAIRERRREISFFCDE